MPRKKSKSQIHLGVIVDAEVRRLLRVIAASRGESMSDTIARLVKDASGELPKAIREGAPS